MYNQEIFDLFYLIYYVGIRSAYAKVGFSGFEVMLPAIALRQQVMGPGKFVQGWVREARRLKCETMSRPISDELLTGDMTGCQQLLWPLESRNLQHSMEIEDREWAALSIKWSRRYGAGWLTDGRSLMASVVAILIKDDVLSWYRLMSVSVEWKASSKAQR